MKGKLDRVGLPKTRIFFLFGLSSSETLMQCQGWQLSDLASYHFKEGSM